MPREMAAAFYLVTSWTLTWKPCWFADFQSSIHLMVVCVPTGVVPSGLTEEEMTCIASYTHSTHFPPLFLSLLAWCRALQTDLDLKLISVTPELCALSKSPDHCLICRMVLRILSVSLDYRKNLNELILVKPWEKCMEHSRCSKKY